MKRSLAVLLLTALVVLTAGFFALAHAQTPGADLKPTYLNPIPGLYVNGWPAFTVTYPKEWVELVPGISGVFRVGVPRTDLPLTIHLPSLNVAAVYAIPLPLEAYEYPLSIVRYALIVGSLTMFFYTFFFNYDPLSFFGIRQILNSRKAKDSGSSADIRKNGLLGIIRHPMYLALIIYLWCQTFRMTDVVINAVLTVYVVVGTKLEEKKLVLEYGDSYIKYQQEVPMLIPFTKAKGN